MRIVDITAIAILALAGGPPRKGGDSLFVEHALPSVPPGVEVEGGIAFSRDGTQVAYVGTRDGKSVPVIGAKVYDPYWYVDRPHFGADGQVAFRVIQRNAKRDQKCWVLLDGKRTAPCDAIDQLSFSPDGRRLAYWTNPGSEIVEDGSAHGGDMVLVVDGRGGTKWKEASTVSPPEWSSDSKHVLTIAGKPPKNFLLLDDRPMAEGDSFDGPVFSPDGTAVAYALARSPKPDAEGALKWLVVCGSRRLGLDFESAGTPVFSPDGTRVAFKAAKGKAVGISLDGAPARLDWEFVARPVFSPDGAHLAFAAAKGCTVYPTTLVISAGDGLVQGGRWQLVVDGEPGKEIFDSVRDVTYSPDSKRVAFRAFTAAGRTAPKWRIVCGDRTSAEFDFVGPPHFSPDSNRIAFGVLIGRDFAWAVLDLSR